MISELLDGGKLTVLLGGGHETAFASYLGVAGSETVRGGKRLGVLNLDAHFDLRTNRCRAQARRSCRWPGRKPPRAAN
ncbi:formimidoylglutamase [Arthrobacter sp. Hiyo8]|nr:formimidoylglutamase [Arthrobacter sp. Hiyo8]